MNVVHLLHGMLTGRSVSGAANNGIDASTLQWPPPYIPHGLVHPSLDLAVCNPTLPCMYSTYSYDVRTQ